MVTAIAAVMLWQNRYILGDDQGIPWRCGADLRHFRARTMGKTCVVGYRTSQDLPDLPGRNLVVWDRDEPPAQLLARISDPSVMIIGGGATYRAFRPWLTGAVVSIIDPRYLVRPVNPATVVTFSLDLVDDPQTVVVRFD